MEAIWIALAGLYIGVLAFLTHWLDRGSRTDDNPEPAPTTKINALKSGASDDEQDINVIALCYGGQRYIWLYVDAYAVEAMVTAHRFAHDPSLSFSDDDCRLICDQIRQRLRSGHA